jgi:hypothetical protein
MYLTSCLFTLGQRAVTLFSQLTYTVVLRFVLTLIQSALLRNLEHYGYSCLIVLFTKRWTTVKFIFLNLYYACLIKLNFIQEHLTVDADSIHTHNDCYSAHWLY